MPPTTPSPPSPPNYSINLELNNNTKAVEYQDLIEGVRGLLSKKGPPIHGRPVLDQGLKFLDVILKTDAGPVTIRIRTDDLYVVGFCKENYGLAKAKWYELGIAKNTQVYDPKEHLISGSSLLGYHGVYEQIEKTAGIGDKKDVGKKVGVSRERIALGKEPFLQAARDLATLGADDKGSREDIGRALIVIIQTISEAVRFTPVFHHVWTNWGGDDDDEKDKRHAGPGQIPDPILFLYENNWSLLCQQLVASNPVVAKSAKGSEWSKNKQAEPQVFTLNADKQKNLEITTAEDALKVVAMIVNPLPA